MHRDWAVIADVDGRIRAFEPYALRKQYFPDGFQGHNITTLAENVIQEIIPIYKREDANCCPSGGKQEIVYSFDGRQLTVVSQEKIRDGSEKQIGYIKNISSQDGRISLVIDYVQWISPCPADTPVGECPNNFLLINDNPQLRAFPVSDDARVGLGTYRHTSSGDYQGEWVPLPTFLQIFNNPTPMYPAPDLLYWITLEDGIVTAINEQYLP